MGDMCVSRCFYPIKSYKGRSPFMASHRRCKKSQNKCMASPCPCPGGSEQKRVGLSRLFSSQLILKMKISILHLNLLWKRFREIPGPWGKMGPNKPTPAINTCGGAVFQSLCSLCLSSLLSPLQGLGLGEVAEEFKMKSPPHGRQGAWPPFVSYQSTCRAPCSPSGPSTLYLPEWRSGLALSHPHWLTWSFM